MKKPFTLVLLITVLFVGGYAGQAAAGGVISLGSISPEILVDSTENQQFTKSPDKNSVTVYPNPFQGTVQVTLPAGATKMEIRNMVGQVVFSQENIETTVLILYLGHLAPGPYFLSVFVGTKHELLRLIRE